MITEHTLSITVRNRPGVMTKIAGMFYRRDFNIETLTVGKTHIDGVSKIVITVPSHADELSLLQRQIENLVDVYEVRLLDGRHAIKMEMCLIGIAFESPEERLQIMATAQPYRPRIRGTSLGTVTLEVADEPGIVDDFVAVMGRYRIVDVSRTGMTAIGSGDPTPKSGRDIAAADPHETPRPNPSTTAEPHERRPS
jgi:acetolactate synthase-1/3 small subunit